MFQDLDEDGIKKMLLADFFLKFHSEWEKTVKEIMEVIARVEILVEQLV